MTQRIGTGANAELTVYAVTPDATPRPIESNRPVGSVLGVGLTVRAPSATASLLLSAGPCNPGRFYVQGATLVNTDSTNTVWIGNSASNNTTVAIPILPGAALRLDVNALTGLFAFATAGAPVLKIVGV
jgi:hypothetical protein